MSMYSIGKSGLIATSSALDTVSNNIANASTAGFKSSSTSFSAVYSGGQAGGTEASTVTQSFSSDGSLVESGSDMDLAITGSGFFVISDGTETAYTRAGNFSLDSDNYVLASNGWNLQGYTVNADGEIEEGAVVNLQVTTTTLSAKASTEVEIVSNLNSSSTAITSTFDASDSSTYNYSTTTTLYDSQGAEHTLSQYFVKTGDNTWTVYYEVDGTLETETTDLTFDTDGTLSSPTSATSLSIDLSSADDLTISIDYSDFTQYSMDSTTTTNEADGYTAGTLSDVAFDEDGYLWATYSNGETLLQGQVVLATFVNVDGLEQGDGTIWYATSESGGAIISTADSGIAGSLSVGYYEDSNVDLTTELVDLMSLQRNYQANSKVLSTASDLDSVLFNTF
ncbi:flagellar hook protein FlgE [Aeromonas sp. RU39B]|uniref:flagellar hook protein FlgE n=1 Tax=Aeromonas sp. RU39B TaxID=1907416 RepID=UPI000954864C|nr:flagellar hook-basal body complex protein [Aeromonas sp. RU39B]SIR16745.1 flagellar hook protein FlgE [Aeromonas sp. RU39B]